MTRAVNVRVVDFPTSSRAIVVQAWPPLRWNPGVETNVSPGCGVSQSRTCRAAASPVFVTRSRYVIVSPAAACLVLARFLSASLVPAGPGGTNGGGGGGTGGCTGPSGSAEAAVAAG